MKLRRTTECFAEQNSVGGQGFSLVYRDLQHIFKEEENIHMPPPELEPGRRGQVPLREGMALGAVGRGEGRRTGVEI